MANTKKSLKLIPKHAELKLRLEEVYGEVPSYAPVSGKPNMVLVPHAEIEGRYFPWVYEADGPYRGWDPGDGPVDANGELIPA